MPHRLLIAVAVAVLALTWTRLRPSPAEQEQKQLHVVGSRGQSTGVQLRCGDAKPTTAIGSAGACEHLSCEAYKAFEVRRAHTEALQLLQRAVSLGSLTCATQAALLAGQVALHAAEQNGRYSSAVTMWGEAVRRLLHQHSLSTSATERPLGSTPATPMPLRFAMGELGRALLLATRPAEALPWLRRCVAGALQMLELCDGSQAACQEPVLSVVVPCFSDLLQVRRLLVATEHSVDAADCSLYAVVGNHSRLLLGSDQVRWLRVTCTRSPRPLPTALTHLLGSPGLFNTGVAVAQEGGASLESCVVPAGGGSGDPDRDHYWTSAHVPPSTSAQTPWHSMSVPHNDDQLVDFTARVCGEGLEQTRTPYAPQTKNTLWNRPAELPYGLPPSGLLLCGGQQTKAQWRGLVWSPDGVSLLHTVPLHAMLLPSVKYLWVLDTFFNVLLCPEQRLDVDGALLRGFHVPPVAVHSSSNWRGVPEALLRHPPPPSRSKSRSKSPDRLTGPSARSFNKHADLAYASACIPDPSPGAQDRWRLFKGYYRGVVRLAGELSQVQVHAHAQAHAQAPKQRPVWVWDSDSSYMYFRTDRRRMGPSHLTLLLEQVKRICSDDCEQRFAAVFLPQSVLFPGDKHVSQEHKVQYIQQQLAGEQYGAEQGKGQT